MPNDGDIVASARGPSSWTVVRGVLMGALLVTGGGLGAGLAVGNARRNDDDGASFGARLGARGAAPSRLGLNNDKVAASLAGRAARATRASLVAEAPSDVNQGAPASAPALAAALQAENAKLAHDRDGLVWAKGTQNTTIVAAEQDDVAADEGALTMIDRAIGEQNMEVRPDPTNQTVWQANPATSVLFAAAGPKYTNVVQGPLGDCYSMASLAAVALSDPAFIERNIWQTSGTEYSVLLYVLSSSGADSPTTVSVDLTDLVAPASVDPATNRDILWPSLYEVALAKAAETSPQDTTGWMDVGDGGSTLLALNTITGAWDTAEYLNLDTLTPASLREQLAAHFALVCGSNAANVPLGIVEAHAYTVVAIANNDHVTVRNPWGIWAALRCLDAPPRHRTPHLGR